MRSDPRFLALATAWQPVLVWFEGASTRCPCKTIVAPHVAEWQTFSGATRRGDYEEQGEPFRRHALAEQLKALRLSIGTIQRFSGDERSDFAPLDEAIREMRRHGFKGSEGEACAAGDPHCEVLRVVIEQRPAPASDPHIGGPADALMGLFGDATKALGETAAQGGREAAREIIGAAGDAARSEIPKVAATVKAEAPGVVQVAGEAARPVATDVAREAGAAAVKGGKDEAKGSAVLGVLAVLGIVGGVMYAATRPKKKEKP